jgi:hypothetical protein
MTILLDLNLLYYSRWDSGKLELMDEYTQKKQGKAIIDWPHIDQDYQRICQGSLLEVIMIDLNACHDALILGLLEY